MVSLINSPQVATEGNFHGPKTAGPFTPWPPPGIRRPTSVFPH